MAKIIAIANQKGGVGKTTTTVNLSASLAFLGKKVLVIDVDPQGNTTSGLGVEKSSKMSIYEVIIDGENIHDAIVNTGIDTLKLCPSNMNLAGAEVELVSVISRENQIKAAIEDIQGEYDYIFFDCPPSLGLLTVNALTAANTILVPIQCEYYALEGLSQLMNTVRIVKKYFKNKVYRTIIPRNIKLSEAPSHGLPIILYDDKSKGAEAYLQLAKEVIENSEGGYSNGI